jgi:2-oxoglutarate ferredoxin oxidoreductase subunit delta
MPQILIDRERCKACALCVEACPQGVLSIGRTLNAHGYNFAEVRHATRCLGCQLCCIACPDSAIEMRASAVLYDTYGA